MTDREKIIKIMQQAGKKYGEIFRKGMKEMFSDGAKECIYSPGKYDEYIANALVAAGIGDCAELLDMWRALLETQCKRTEEAEHRAEVAERALRRKCEIEADSTCPCDENSDKCKECAENRLCSTKYATQCYYEKAIQQAEREIEEEERK